MYKIFHSANNHQPRLFILALLACLVLPLPAMSASSEAQSVIGTVTKRSDRSGGSSVLDSRIERVKTIGQRDVGGSQNQEKSANRPVKDKWALVIGISKFQDPTINLKYPAKEVRAVHLTLTGDVRLTSFSSQVSMWCWTVMWTHGRKTQAAEARG